jgi:hypothetical protein
MNLPRGKYIGKRVGQPATDEAEHFIRAQPAADRSTAVIWFRFSSMKAPCPIQRRINRNDRRAVR